LFDARNVRIVRKTGGFCENQAQIFRPFGEKFKHFVPDWHNSMSVRLRPGAAISCAATAES
jgi:hypothetical protein